MPATRAGQSGSLNTVPRTRAPPSSRDTTRGWLICTALGLLIAIPAFFSFYWLRNRAAKLIHNVQEMIGSLYRKMPYEYLAGVHIGDEELYAAVPNWVQQAQPETTQG